MVEGSDEGGRSEGLSPSWWEGSDFAEGARGAHGGCAEVSRQWKEEAERGESRRRPRGDGRSIREEGSAAAHGKGRRWGWRW